MGEWESGCSIDICTITTLRPDHTFSVRFDEKGSSDSYSGTWRIDDDQLVAHVTAADKVLQDIVGKDLRLTMSDFHHDRFMATLAVDEKETFPWKRLR